MNRKEAAEAHSWKPIGPGGREEKCEDLLRIVEMMS